MEAIILAAGVGRRLGNCSDNKPKCMLEFDGISLLRRHLSILNHYNISNIIVVTGYQSDRVINEIACSESSHITNTIYNPDFEKGSLNSRALLWPGMAPRGVFCCAHPPCQSGSFCGASGADHDLPGMDIPLRQARTHRPVDLAHLALCLVEWRPRVLDALPSPGVRHV